MSIAAELLEWQLQQLRQEQAKLQDEVTHRREAVAGSPDQALKDAATDSRRTVPGGTRREHGHGPLDRQRVAVDPVGGGPPSAPASEAREASTMRNGANALIRPIAYAAVMAAQLHGEAELSQSPSTAASADPLAVVE